MFSHCYNLLILHLFVHEFPYPMPVLGGPDLFGITPNVIIG